MKIPSVTVAFAILGVTLLVPASNAQATEAAIGELAFHRNCGSCHSMEKDKNLIGPSLHMVFGRKAGSLDNYRYSNALRALDTKWTAENLDTYIKDTQSFAPGNKMWVRFPDAKTREEIIAFLAARSETGK